MISRVLLVLLSAAKKNLVELLVAWRCGLVLYLYLTDYNWRGLLIVNKCVGLF